MESCMQILASRLSMLSMQQQVKKFGRVKHWKTKDSPALRAEALPTGKVAMIKGSYILSGNYLMAIDATTGKIIPSFGTDGKVNLNEGVRR